MNHIAKQISIIIPTYKRPERLNLTLKSLCQQSYSKEDFEVIVINDGCDHKTKEVVDAYTTNINIQMILGKGKGPATAKNQALPLAKGDILLFLDDDVLCHSDFLHRHAGYYNGDSADNTVVTAQRKHLYMQIPGKDMDWLMYSLEHSFNEIAAMARDDPHCKLLEKAYADGSPV